MVLLDTHIVVWWLNDSEDSQLSAAERELLEQEARNGELAMSAISLWEIQILTQKKRLKFTMPFEQWIREATRPDVVRILPLDVPVILAAHQLPKSFHGDPADRIIAATCIANNVSLISHDRKLKRFCST